MNSHASIAPLRIANEAFMVAATIERCPRQMMLRELVMNALEAAAGATDAPKRVRIDAVVIDNAKKLRLWNTGRGLSQAELLQISDLSSSLFKTVALDGNFGMGAKAASLASNKEGLRYRSCRLGKVSQIVLGARDGVYGRILQLDPVDGRRREAIDVTVGALAAGEDLSHDWTEVTLFGNSPEQDTAADPYAGDPALPRDWVTRTLARRFVRLPEGVELAIEPSASGAATREIFAPPLAASSFDRLEAVEVEGGVVIHYGYRAKDSALPPQRAPVVGLGAVVYDGEVYALTEERRWALEAPSYGFTFAARQCSVIVELPHDFGARPEQYRQFLRFIEGDQHQVQFADFGELVRRNLPVWLKRIIAAQLPSQSDYLAEIRDEMRSLLAELGIEDLLRAPQPPKPKAEGPRSPEPPPAQTPPEARRDPPSTAPKPPPPKPKPKPPEAPSPPEIITIEDEADIVEKALGGRAARYYPAARQVFVNARYAAFARMQAQLAEEFAPFADDETIKRFAKQTSEWAIIQRIARTLLHSIGKPKSGWSADEVKTVQSPETMSLMVDDIDPLLGPARRRMAAQLGLEAETTGDFGSGGDATARRVAGELADAEARLQRALTGNVKSLGPFYRQLGSIHMRQRNVAAARAWLEKGMAADANDHGCRNDYISLLLAENELDRAAALVDEALALTNNLLAFRRQRAEVEIRRGNLAQAEAVLAEAAAQEPESPWPHYDLSGLYLRQDRFDAAASAADAALRLTPVPSSNFVRRRAEVELRRGDAAAARRLFNEARAIDPADAWAYLQLAKLDMAEEQYESAARELEAGLALRTSINARLHRTRAEMEQKRGDQAAAIAAVQRAIAADPNEASSWDHLAALLMATGELDKAAEAAAESVRLLPTGQNFYVRQAEIEKRRKDPKSALAILERAADLLPNAPRVWLEIAGYRMASNDLDGADEAAKRASEGLLGAEKLPALRRRADIAAKRKDSAAAEAFLREAMAVAPKDPWSRFEAAQRRLDEGDDEGGSALLAQALTVCGPPSPALLKRAAGIEERRRNWENARGYLRQAVVAGPEDPANWSALAGLLARTGDLSGAREAAEKAVFIASGGQETGVAAAAP